MRCLLALLVLLVSAAGALSAPNALASALPVCADCAAPLFFEPAFEQIGDAGSVPDGVVSALAEDRSGLIWIGTPSGLIRYDGYRFRLHTSQAGDSESLGGSFIRALLVGADGRVWIGTESDGLSVYDPRRERFQSFRHDPEVADSLPAGSVRALAAAPDGGLWIGTIGGGLARLHPGDDRLQQIPSVTADGSAFDRRIQVLLVDRKGDLWIGSWSGLLRWRRGAESIERVDIEQVDIGQIDIGPVDRIAGAETPLAGQIISQIFEDANATLWVGTQVGNLYRLDPGGDHPRQVDDEGPDDSQRGRMINAMVQPNAAQLWIARDSGIEVRDVGSGKRLGQLRHDPLRPTSLAGNEVRTMLRDRAGWIWVGGYGGGLQHFNPGNTSFRVRRGENALGGIFAEPNVRSVQELANGQIWAGTQERGVAIFDARLQLIDAIPAGIDGGLGAGRVSGIAQTTDGSIWLASDSGLYRLHGESRSLRLFHGIKGRVRKLFADTNDALWIATEDGLYRHEAAGSSLDAVLDEDARPLSGDVNAIVEAADGRFWVGSESGLYTMAPGDHRLRRVREEDGHGMTHPLVLGLLIDREQQLWIDSPAGLHKLLRWDGRLAAFDAVSERLGIAGLPFGANLLQDSQGRLWTHRYVYDPALDSVYALGSADGVDFGTGWFRSYAKTRDGRLLFGGSHGLLMVDTERFQPSTYQPPLVLTELKINGQSRPLVDPLLGLRLAPDQRSVSLEFSALDFSAPQRLQYAYRLEGADSDWIAADAGYRVATYGNLPPGDYLFRARGSNRSGEWSPHELAIPIRVLPRWWETWWFRLLMLLGGVVIVFVLIQLRTASLQKNRRWLEAKVRTRTAELERVSQDLQLKSRALEEASLTDPLTGLRNRRFLVQQLDADVRLTVRRHENANRAEQPAPEDDDLVFFLIDIDHFKQVNDHYGHAAGDSVLLQMRGRLQDVFRESDYLVRWGGEEFLIVARASSRRHAEELAERARSSVERAPFELDDGRRLEKTCSIGFACFPMLPSHPRAVDWAGVVELANLAMYAAKHAGRNGWVGVLATSTCDPQQLGPRLKKSAVSMLQEGQLQAVGSYGHAVIMAAFSESA